MKEFLTTFAAMVLLIGGVIWITPAWLATIADWLLCALVILLFLPNVFF